MDSSASSATSKKDDPPRAQGRKVTRSVLDAPFAPAIRAEGDLAVRTTSRMPPGFRVCLLCAPCCDAEEPHQATALDPWQELSLTGEAKLMRFHLVKHLQPRLCIRWRQNNRNPELRCRSPGGSGGSRCVAPGRSSCVKVRSRPPRSVRGNEDSFPFAQAICLGYRSREMRLRPPLTHYKQGRPLKPNEATGLRYGCRKIKAIVGPRCTAGRAPDEQ